MYGPLNPDLTVREWRNRVRKVAVPELRNYRFPNEQPYYPALQTPKGTERFVAREAKLLYAIAQGKAVVIPERDPDTGKNNFDLICDACGNREGDVCTLRRFLDGIL